MNNSVPVPSGDPSPSPWKWVLRLLLGLALLALIAARRGTIREIGAIIGGIPPLVLGASMAVYLAGQALCAWKWQLLLRARGVQVTLWECCRWYLAGMFGNLWLPTNIGGDGLRAVLLSPKAGMADAAASIALDRLTGFAALLAIAIVGLAATSAQNGQTLAIVGAALATFIFLGLLVTGALFLMGRFPAHKIARKAESLKRALAFYVTPSARGTLLGALLISVVFQASQVVLNIALARAAGLHVSPGVFWWLAPLLSLSGLLPVGIGGLGVREAAAVALLQGQGLPVSTGAIVAWSLMWQATVWLASLPGMIFVRRRN